jgi:hypothetical protein
VCAFKGASSLMPRGGGGGGFIHIGQSSYSMGLQ